MTPQPVKTAVVGCGMISSIYLQNAQTHPILDIVACADLDLDRAAAQADKFNVPRVLGVADVLADPEIELIINLTVPVAHGTIGIAAVKAGKSVYNEKPLAISREDGALMLAEAREHGVRVGCAPDTFLGAGLQTCRALIDDGAIGEPVGATALMLGSGPERWHADPDFFYQVGAGPMFDMGPYYLTALVAMLGSVRRVTGSVRATYPERTVGSGPKRGDKITVNTPTHIAGVLDFASGPIGTIVTSFDVSYGHVPRLEIYGSEATLSMPDPNTFGGPVRLRRAREDDWEEIPLTHAYAENSRGIGVADMAKALRSDRPHRANGEMAYHVLDIMHAFHEASHEGRHVELSSSCDRPQPLPRIGEAEEADV